MKSHMRMPQRRPAMKPGAAVQPAMNAGSPMGNPDMMEQEQGIVVPKSMAPPRLGSLKHLRQMMQGHGMRRGY